MSKFVNFTPHAITLRGPDGDQVIPPSGQVARVATEERVVRVIDGGMPVVVRKLGEVSIPEFAEDEYALVSSMVLEAAMQQGHPRVFSLLAPDSGPTAIREGGQVKAVTRLISAR